MTEWVLPRTSLELPQPLPCFLGLACRRLSLSPASSHFWLIHKLYLAYRASGFPRSDQANESSRHNQKFVEQESKFSPTYLSIFLNLPIDQFFRSHINRIQPPMVFGLSLQYEVTYARTKCTLT